ncbi:MAG: ATP-grasp domain-containing protein [Thermoanaerobaculia bacterium]
MKTRILFVGGSDSAELLEAAERRGIEIVMMLLPAVLAKTSAGAPVIALEPLDLYQPLSAIVASIIEVARRYGVAGIAPVLEFGMMPGVIAAAKLGFPACSVAAVRATRDKTAMRRALDRAGLRQIAHAACRTPEEASDFFTRTGAPIIVKPVSGSGSDGVMRVDRLSQLDEAWTLATTSLGFTGVICEQYIEGPEVSVEGYCLDGAFVPVAITDKTTNEHFVEIGHDQPSRYPADVQQRIFDYTARVLSVLGVTNGWTHTEVRLGSTDPQLMDPVVIETHTRRGGASIDTLTHHTTGVSTNDVMFDFALGIAPTARPRVTGGAAAVRFINGPPGVIDSVDIPQLPERGVDRVQIDLRPGESVQTRNASASRIGRIVATGRDVDQAIANAETLRARVHLHYRSTAGEQDDHREAQWITPAA